MASYRAVPPPGRRPRIPFSSFDMSSIRSETSSAEEFYCGLLLEPEAFPDAVAGIDQDCQPQRQIRFGGELLDYLGLLAFDDLEIVLPEIRDKAALLVGDSEEHVDPGNVQDDAGVFVGFLDFRRLWRAHGLTGLGP